LRRSVCRWDLCWLLDSKWIPCRFLFCLVWLCCHFYCYCLKISCCRQRLLLRLHRLRLNEMSLIFQIFKRIIFYSNRFLKVLFKGFIEGIQLHRVVCFKRHLKVIVFLTKTIIKILQINSGPLIRNLFNFTSWNKWFLVKKIILISDTYFSDFLK
jgi:hypothetical protein